MQAQRQELDEVGGPPPVVLLPPLKPHRNLFIIAGGIVAVWLGFLLYLYITTIRPHAGSGGAPVPLSKDAAPTSGPALTFPR